MLYLKEWRRTRITNCTYKAWSSDEAEEQEEGHLKLQLTGVLKPKIIDFFMNISLNVIKCQILLNSVLQ